MADSEAALAAPIVFKKGKGGKRRQRAKRGSDSDHDDGDAVIKQRAKQLKGAIVANSKPEGVGKNVDDVYVGRGEARDRSDMGATRLREEETEQHRDRRAQQEAFMNNSEAGDGTYKGMQGYKDWKQGLRRENEVPIHGPQRVSQFVRTTIRIDYQPDVCKDYKETGFCSYGDSCKFLHDRGDYKSGWELERDWQAQQKAKREKIQQRLVEGRDPEESTEEEDDEEELPFACYICRRNWPDCPTEPVRTVCLHYFCEACALEHHAKDPTCAVCDKQTHGTFNIADDIVQKFELKKRHRSRGAVAGGTGAWSTEDGDDGGGGWSAE
eukprot:jgi/Ulvmu1/6511/UM003_0144.1